MLFRKFYLFLVSALWFLAAIVNANATDVTPITCTEAIGGINKDIPQLIGVAGDTFTIVEPFDTGSSVTFTDGTHTLAGTSPFTFTLPADGTYNNDGDDARGANVYCTPAAAAATDEEEAASTSDVQANLTPLIMNSQGAAMGDAVSSATGNALGNGGGQNFVNENGFALSTSGLAAMANSAAVQQLSGNASSPDQGIYAADITPSDFAAVSPLNLWVQGNLERYEGHGEDFDGHVSTLLAGIDYRVSDALVLGLLAGYGTADIDTRIFNTGGNLSSDGYSLGGYFGSRLAANVFADGFIAYTGSDYDVRYGAVTGDFDASRVTGGINVYGSMPMGGFTLQPEFSVFFAREKQDSYTDSGGTLRGAQTFESGRVSAGPKLIFDAIDAGSGNIKPWVAAKLEHNFSSRDTPALTSSVDVGNSTSGRFSAGLTTQLGAGSLSLSGDISGVGSGDYLSYSGKIHWGISF